MIFNPGPTTEQLALDPASSAPLAGTHLVYKRGSASNYFAIADSVARPLGMAQNVPSLAGSVVVLDRFGAKVETTQGWASGAVTVDHLVYSAANGLIGDLTLAGSGTFWVVGLAVCSASGPTSSNTGLQPVVFIPCLPYQVNQ